MTYDFIINSENVNEYGYRILTDGVDTEQYMRNPVVLFGHQRASHDPKKVVGRCIKLYKKGTDLVATVEFDEADDYAKDVAGKVERDYIRMASMYADVIETSMEEEFVIKGQTLETVTKCKLVELSIVDIGGNDNALKLSRDGNPVKLQKIKKTKTQDMSLKTIALAMGLTEDADSSGIVKKYNELKLAKETAETKAKGLEDDLKKIKGDEADALVAKAVELNLIPEDLKETVRGAFDTDFDGQKVKLSKLIDEKEADNTQRGKHEQLKEVILGGGKGSKQTVKLTYDYLQKHDPDQLREIRDKQPKEYARLAKEYGNGVRHKDN